MARKSFVDFLAADSEPQFGGVPSQKSRRSTIHSHADTVINGIKAGRQPSSVKDSKDRMEQVVASMKDPTRLWDDGTGDGRSELEGDGLKFAQEKPEYVSEKMAFTGFIGSIVVANAITIGVEMDYPSNKTAYLVLEHIFTTIFTAEMLFKLRERGCKAYFSSGWNILDFVLVSLSILDCWVMGIVLLVKPDLTSGADLRVYSMLRLLRLIRVVRAVRLLSMFQELWKIVRGIMSSVRTVLWSFMLLLFLLYVCGLFCCTMIGKNTSAGYYRSIDDPNAEEFHSDWDAYEHFGTVPRSMFTLFETCLEPLNLRPILERQPIMLPFFLAFIFITTFGVLNVIIGTIVDNTMAVSKAVEDEDHLRETSEKLRKLDRIREMSTNKVFDTDDDGTLSLDELQAAMGLPLIMETLAEIQVISGMQPEELFALLDSRGDGQVTSGDMIIQLAREAIHNEHQQLMDLKISTNQKHNWVRTALTDLTTTTTNIKASFKDIKKYLKNGENGIDKSDSKLSLDGDGSSKPNNTISSDVPLEFLPPHPPEVDGDTNVANRLDNIESDMSALRTDMHNLVQVISHMAAKIGGNKSGTPMVLSESGNGTPDHVAAAWTLLNENEKGPRNFKPRLVLPGAPTTA